MLGFLFLQSKESTLKRGIEEDGSSVTSKKKKKKKSKSKKHKICSPGQSDNSQLSLSHSSQNPNKTNKMPQMATGAVNANGPRQMCSNSKVHRISAWVDSVDTSYAPSEQGTCVSSPAHSSHETSVEFFNHVGDFLFPPTQGQNETKSRPPKHLNKRSVNKDKSNNNVKTRSEHPSPLNKKGSPYGTGKSVTEGKQSSKPQTGSGTGNLHTPFSPLSRQPTLLGANSDKTDNRQKLPGATAYQAQSLEDMQLDSQPSFHGLVGDNCDVPTRTQIGDDSESAMDIDNYEELEEQIKLEVQ